jgi:hypothetical protein
MVCIVAFEFTWGVLTAGLIFFGQRFNPFWVNEVYRDPRCAQDDCKYNRKAAANNKSKSQQQKQSAGVLRSAQNDE